MAKLHGMSNNMISSGKIIDEVMKSSVRSEKGVGTHTPSQIKKMFEKLPKEKKQEILEEMKFKVSPEEEATLLHKILMLCKRIVGFDTNFENKMSEVEMAKQVAEKIQKLYDELIVLVEQVEPKDTSLVKEMLEILDHPWMRVLGDQLKRKDDLEKKLRDLRFHVSLEKKKHLNNIDKFLSQLKIPRDQEINADTIRRYTYV
jgi:Asp-tRNA(Asn)/Glu-tRNA(Gln) amidotransferase C subunit